MKTLRKRNSRWSWSVEDRSLHHKDRITAGNMLISQLASETFHVDIMWQYRSLSIRKIRNIIRLWLQHLAGRRIDICARLDYVKQLFGLDYVKQLFDWSTSIFSDFSVCMPWSRLCPLAAFASSEQTVIKLMMIREDDDTQVRAWIRPLPGSNLGHGVRTPRSCKTIVNFPTLVEIPPQGSLVNNTTPESWLAGQQ